MNDKKSWIKQRVASVNEVYSVHDALVDCGIELIDQHTDLQIPCPLPGHGPDNRPSARYYGGVSKAHFYCFKCKENLGSSVNVLVSVNGMSFMDALKSLEKRFNIKVQKQPDAQPEVQEPSIRTSEYKSEKRYDVPTMLGVLEKKLKRIRDLSPLVDYIKFCRLLDLISYDFEKDEKSTPEMANALDKLLSRMDEVALIAKSSSLEDECKL